MAIGWMVLAWLAMSPPAAAAEVTVCIASEGIALTSPATSIAGSALAKAGVAVTWRCPTGPRRDGPTRGGQPGTGVPRTWLRIRLVDEGKGDRLPGALAVSYPFAGCSKDITVYLDRVRLLAQGPHRESALLGYVLAHEITHVAQGLVRHSDTGVMKPRWGRNDLAAIFEGRLGFEDWDVHLMRQGLAAGWCSRAASVSGRFGSRTVFRPE